jgi:hypothetical protein
MTPNPIAVLRRGKEWKSYVEQTLLRLSAELDLIRDDLARKAADNRALQEENMRLHGELDRIGRQLSVLLKQGSKLRELQARSFHRKAIAPLGADLPELAALGDDYLVLCGRRSSQLLILFIRPDDPQRHELRGETGTQLLEGLADSPLDEVALIIPCFEGRHITCRSDALLEAIATMPLDAMAWLEQHRPPGHAAAPPTTPDYFARLSAIVEDIDRLDFRARAARSRGPIESPPFDQPKTLPRLNFAEPRQKSALLLHNPYYHFNCLSAGLRRRGWDTLTVSLQAPDSPDRQFLHGEDLNLFDPDPAVMMRRTREFFSTIPERFGSLHFYGQGYATFFGQYVENNADPHTVPWDFLELRRHRLIIGYMPSGCMDGGLQSSIKELADGLCERCVWELRPDICSDARSLAWNRKLALLCDWVGLECDHATPERISRKTVYGPVVTTLDPERWRPGLSVPDDLRIESVPGEILIYHAVGNYAARRRGDRDIKGTGAVTAAVEELKAEGFPVRLVFAHDIPSSRVRFVQTQADIVVDQLNYGRYGANAREAMMLGKPTICRLRPTQASPLPPLRPIQEVPMVDADETSVVDKLRSLVLNADERRRLGDEARKFALAWHGEDACAERYERVTDRVRAGLPADSPDLYPS